MKIKRIKLENYRGVASFETTFDDKGTSIVEGPNESGKSSLFEALDLLMEHYDDTQKASVKQVKPVNADVGPVIEAEIEAGPYHFVYLKQFLKGKRTELKIVKPHPENLSGREAHHRVEQILDEHVDLHLWKAVRMQQGIEVQQAELEGASSLARALDRAAGTASVGASESALCDAARAECEKWYTENNFNEKKPLKSAAESVKTLEQQLAESEQRLRELDHHVQRLAEIERDEHRLRTDLISLEDRATQREAALAQVEVEGKRVALLSAELQAAQSRAQQANEAHERRASDAAQVERRAKEVDALTEQIALDEPARRRAIDENNRLTVEVQALQTADQCARETLRLRHADLDAMTALDDINSLTDRIERAEVEKATIEAADAVLGVNRIDDDTLAELRDADLAVRIARDRLRDGGPTLKVEALASISATVNGDPLSLPAGDATEIAVLDEVQLVLPGVAAVTVTPGTSLSDLHAKLYEAEVALSERLEACGAANLEDASRQQKARTQATTNKQNAQKALKTILGKQTLEALRASVGKKRAGVNTHLEARKAMVDAPALPSDVTEAGTLREQAETVATRATEALRTAQERLTQATLAMSEAQMQKATLEGTLKSAVSERDTARAALEAARAAISDAALSEEASRAAEAARQAAVSYEEASRRLAAACPEDLEIHASAARSAVENTAATLRKLDGERHDIRGKLSVLGEEGLYDTVEGTRTGLERARRDLARQQRLAGAARLLHTTLETHRDAQRRAYVTPLRERIERLGRLVFGDSLTVTLTESLAIASRTLDGVTVPFESLSTGAREQLCMITRVASALLVCDEGGVPVVLDDTLGHTDASRLASMGAVLAVAGRHCQVILMTCAPERYRHLSQARVISLSKRQASVVP